MWPSAVPAGMAPYGLKARSHVLSDFPGGQDFLDQAHAPADDHVRDVEVLLRDSGLRERKNCLFTYYGKVEGFIGGEISLIETRSL